MSSKSVIALCGAHSGGKTTLAKRLAAVMGPNIACITHSRPTEAARRLGYDSARDVPNNDDIQWDFQIKGLFAQIHAQSRGNPDHYKILDRSTYDFLAYTNHKMPWLRGTKQHDLYEQIALEFGNYHYLFYCPNPGDKPEDNGIRLLSNPEPIEQELLRIFAKHNIKYHHIKATTIDERLKEVSSILGIV